MADGGAGDNGPGLVRRQVKLTVFCVIDVPANLDEEAVKFLVEEHHCNSDLIMSLAEQIAHDDEKEECNVCILSEATLVPVANEIQSAWLNNLPQPARANFGDEEEAAEEESDVEEEEEEDGDVEDEEESDDEDEKPEPLK